MGTGFDLPSFREWRDLTLSVAQDPRNWRKDGNGFNIRRKHTGYTGTGGTSELRSLYYLPENCHFPKNSDRSICELYDLNYEWLADSPELPGADVINSLHFESQMQVAAQRRLMGWMMETEPQAPTGIPMGCQFEACGLGTVRILPRRPRTAVGGNRFDRKEAGLFTLMRTHDEGSASQDLGFRCIRRLTTAPNLSSKIEPFKETPHLGWGASAQIYFTDSPGGERKVLGAADDLVLALVVKLERHRNPRIQEILVRRIFRSLMDESEIQRVLHYGLQIQGDDGSLVKDYEWSNSTLPIVPWRSASGPE
jgi:hypothetical protein